MYIHHTAFSQSDGRCVPTDESEHYDLKQDPFQLDNRFPAPLGSTDEQTQRRLAARAERLADCAGIAGRDPDPVGRIHCE